MSSATNNTRTAPATLAATPPTPKVEQTSTATEVYNQVDKKEMTTESNAYATADAKSDELCKDMAGATTTTTVANVKAEEKAVDEAKEVKFLKGDTPMGHQEEPATKEAPKEENATAAPVVKTIANTAPAEEIEPPKDDTSEEEPAKTEAVTKEMLNEEGAFVATIAGEKRSAIDAADANEKIDGSPPKKFAESVSEEQPATEIAAEAEEVESLKGDTPMEQPVREEPAAKEAPKEDDAATVPLVTTTVKSVPADEVKPSKEVTSKKEPAKAEAATKKKPNKEDALATAADEKRSSSDVAVADEKRDGSLPKKVVEGMSKEQPATELVDAIVEKKEDPPCAHPVSEENTEMITVKSIEPPKEDASEESSAKEEAVAKKAPEKEGDLVAAFSGEKRSVSAAAIADKKKDGSPPKKVVISKFVGLPATEVVVGVVDCAHPISEDKIEKMAGTPVKV